MFADPLGLAGGTPSLTGADARLCCFCLLVRLEGSSVRNGVPLIVGLRWGVCQVCFRRLPSGLVFIRLRVRLGLDRVRQACNQNRCPAVHTCLVVLQRARGLPDEGGGRVPGVS